MNRMLHAAAHTTTLITLTTPRPHGLEVLVRHALQRTEAGPVLLLLHDRARLDALRERLLGPLSSLPSRQLARLQLQ